VFRVGKTPPVISISQKGLLGSAVSYVAESTVAPGITVISPVTAFVYPTSAPES